MGIQCSYFVKRASVRPLFFTIVFKAQDSKFKSRILERVIFLSRNPRSECGCELLLSCFRAVASRSCMSRMDLPMAATLLQGWGFGHSAADRGSQAGKFLLHTLFFFFYFTFPQFALFLLFLFPASVSCMRLYDGRPV